MKLMKIFILITMAGFTSFFLFGGSCESGPSSYISFTIDGKSYTYELGLTDIGDGTAFANLYSGSIALLAAGDNTGNSSDPPENYVHISIGSSNPGTYTTAFDSILGFYYRKNDVAYYP